MNYITHLNQWMELVAVDDRLSPNHISIYLALFQLWNKSRFPDQLAVCRNEVLGISKIGSSKTYYKCLHDLNDFGYIRYRPSYNPLRGSVIEINELGESDPADEQDPDDESEPKTTDKSSEKNLYSEADTKVRPEKKRQGICGKNDTGPSHVVTPLYINNINILNSKQRERRAREKKSADCFSIQKEKAAGERKKRAGKSTPRSHSGFSAERRAESRRKKEVPRDFAKPSLQEIKTFFEEMTQPGMIADINAREKEALKFFHHYESNGWLVGGKSPMRNWKASCRSWAVKIPYFNRQAQTSQKNERKNFHVEQKKNYAQAL